VSRDSFNPQVLCIVEQLLSEVIIKKSIFQPTKICTIAHLFCFFPMLVAGIRINEMNKIVFIV